ncbi:hypothetical protein PYW07_012441 [Mythimna separata]|uniref:Glucose-methanol-choline oxidoreductase N-terminal domain-containing protein n=1 Tax=Mythimna separata TaxID=271217 RepID=A0AAD7YM52_MYTSE|nr:hypothetical protein PYW07_012441 [Mythimna separata]
MADAAADTLTAVGSIQAALSVMATLQLTSFRYPPDYALTNGTNYDYIIVGGGTAGLVVANRLSANCKDKVLVIEAGPYPPIESEWPAMFTVTPKTEYDFDTSSVNDKYTAQNLQEQIVSLTQGKMLGGSSNIDHMIHVQGDPHDYNNWAEILGDDTWAYKNVLPYFKKLENMTDPDLLASQYADLHGTGGMLKIARQIADIDSVYKEAFNELGHKIVDDTTSLTSTLGVSNPLLAIGDNIRQSSSNCYLTPAKSRSNLFVALNTIARKILIKDNVATGVQVETSSGDTLELFANKEVIVSAGAIHTPQLLMLSGIGPKSHLEEKGISVIADLPVGENFMDHTGVVLLFQMESDTSAAPAVNPYQFPVPTTTLYAALDSSQTYPDYQSINLLFPHDAGALLQLSANSFKYSNDVSNKFAEANVGRKVLLAVLNLMMPKSRGKVLLASNDPTVEPLVYTGTYTNEDDLDLMTDSLMDFTKVLNTKNFIERNATLVDTGLCPGLSGREYWECYALAMSATMWHYSGTCAMGKVVDSKLLVKGVSNLRVADASVMPTLTSGNIRAPVTMIGERAAAFIHGK